MMKIAIMVPFILTVPTKYFEGGKLYTSFVFVV